MISGRFQQKARDFLFAAGAVALLCATAPAQQQRPPSGNPLPPAREPTSRQFQTPLFLNGEVLPEDGQTPPEDVRVELVCHGSVVHQKFVSPGGGFSFQLGSGRGRRLGAIPADASVSGDSTQGVNTERYGTASMSPFGGSSPGLNFLRSQEFDLGGCELRAVMPGYSSDTIVLGRRRLLDDPNVGTLVLRRLSKAKGLTVSVTSLAAPSRARRAYDKAQKELRKGKPNYGKAARELERAVEVFPEYATAWNSLGEVRASRKDAAGAEKAFKKAIDADADYLPPYVSMANLYFMRQDWRTVREITGQIMELDPDIPRAHFFQAVASFFLGDVKTAGASLDFVHKSSEANHYPLSRYLKGAILAHQGQVIPAAAELRLFLQLSPEGPVADNARRQLEIWKQQGLITDGSPKSDR